MTSPATQRKKPVNIEENCKCCGDPLTLLDLLDGPKEPETIWYDEWTCSNEQCQEYSKVFFDWTVKELKELQDVMTEKMIATAEEW